MATSTIRKAIGAVKDQTSISLAKVAGNVAPDLEVLVVKATTHDNGAADEKYAKEILSMISHSRGYLNACVFAISRRLSKTSDWIVALKALMLVHRLLNEGDPVFGQELMLASRKGARVLNMSDFCDYAHSSSWDQSGFVRSFALYLDQKLELMVYERKVSAGDPKMERDEVKPIRELGPERALERLYQLLRVLDRFLASRPTGTAKNTRMVLVALSMLVKESFRLYNDISDALKYLVDCFSELEYAQSAKAFDAYVNAAKMIDDLIAFYNWCKDIGVVRSSEFPEVQRISVKLLESLEAQLREKCEKPKSSNEAREGSSSEIKEEKEQSMSEIKSLPAPENHNPSTAPPPLYKPPNQEVITEELVNLKDDGVSADKEGNKFALALFSGNTNDKWVEFTTEGEAKVTSAWQNPAAESGKADWELVLVESASHLSNQQADLGGGLDPLLLNGMYDQGAVKQHVDSTQMNGGSASSVALPGMSKNATPVLALPGPDGMMGVVGQQDPFAASLMVPPPAYVQIADMERKQQLVREEQQVWEQYARNGMQGQVGMPKNPVSRGYYDASVPYGMAQHGAFGQPGGYYYTSY